jgi:hypothetical protein
LHILTPKTVLFRVSLDCLDFLGLACERIVGNTLTPTNVHLFNRQSAVCEQTTPIRIPKTALLPKYDLGLLAGLRIGQRLGVEYEIGMRPRSQQLDHFLGNFVTPRPPFPALAGKWRVSFLDRFDKTAVQLGLGAHLKFNLE